MKPTVYVPQDSGALSMGAEEVAAAIGAEASKRGHEIELVRNGSKGMCWLEPLVEVAAPEGRTAYGPVSPSDVTPLFDSGMLEGGKHTLALGPTENIPYFKNQGRLTFSRIGAIDPWSLEDYLKSGGFKGLGNALRLSGEAIIKEVTESGLRGRGGAAFPTGINWKTALDAPSDVKCVVCNADEGDSGTFSDRMAWKATRLF